MTPEEAKQLKPGDKLIYIGAFMCIDEDETIAAQGIDGHHYFWPEEVSLAPSVPANGTKNAETAPKYDPCRLFREGDIVEPCQVKGRWFGTAWKARRGIRFTVTKAEDEEGVMWVQDPDSLHPKDVEAVFFQLVTPVEERERYYIEHDSMGYAIFDRQNVGYVAHFKAVQHPHAKEAAEAECERLNAEYRKEQKND